MTTRKPPRKPTLGARRSTTKNPGEGTSTRFGNFNRDFAREEAAPKRGRSSAGGDKPRGDRSAAPRGDKGRFEKRSFDDRPKRDFGDRPPRRDSGERSFSDRPRRDFGDRPARPARSFDDRPKRDFGDRPPRSENGRFEKRNFDDRPPRRDSGERSFSDRPRRDFGDRPARPTRSYDDRPKRDFGDRPPRRDSGERSFSDRPKRDFGDRAPRGDAGRFEKRSFSDRGPPARAPRSDKTFEKPEAASGAAKRKGHETLFFGTHPVLAALNNPARTVTAIWLTDRADERVLAAIDPTRHPQAEQLDRRGIEKLLPEGTVHQGIVIAVEPLPEVFLSDVIAGAQIATTPQIVVMLDEVTDPHNVGAILRSMSAFDAKALLVHKYNAPSVTGVVAKTSTGASETIPMVVVTNLAKAIDEMKEAGFYCLGLDERADFPIADAPTGKSILLVMGAEGEGLRDKTRASCDAIATIPTFGAIQSLNVSNAAAVALYEVSKKIK